MNPHVKGHISMFSANVCWGLMSPIAKMVMAGGLITPLLLTNFRVAGAAVLFWLLSLAMPKEHVPARDLLRLAGAAMMGIAFNQGCFIFGVGYTSPGEASLITTTMPIWVMILAWVILKEPITWKKGLGIALGASGALILVLGSANVQIGGDKPALGDTLVLLAQLSYASYLTFYKRLIDKYSMVTLMKWMFTFAAIVVTVVSFPSLLKLDWTSVGLTSWLGVGYVLVFGTFIAYIFTITGQKTLRPTLVGMYNYVQPIVATLVGVFLGLDRFTPIKALAVVLIFTGVYFVTKSRARAASAPRTAA